MDSELVTRETLTEGIDDLINEGDAPFSIAVVDIDGFSYINNTFGTEIGDEVIKKLISTFKCNLDAQDLVTRRGDEFTILLARKGAERSFMEMEEIRRHMSDNTFELSGANKNEAVNITFSCGIASYPRDAKNSIELFRVADSALFRAKKLGKNKVCLSEAESMVLKSSYFTKTQVDRLAQMSKQTNKTEAFLLREALDDLFKKHSR